MATAWAAGLAWACRPIIAAYFPVWDEWLWLEQTRPQDPHFLAWITKGISEMKPAYPSMPLPPFTDYVRPFYALVYWLHGLVFGDFYGGFLYFNYAAIGACAGLAYLYARSGRLNPAPEPVAVALACLLPLMPAFIYTDSALAPLFTPMLAFDPAIAALSLLACLAYDKGRHGAAAACAFVALFTKENAVPVAVALPLLLAWQQRRELRRAARPLLLLSAPLLAWVLLRWIDFGHIGDSYEGEINVRNLLTGFFRLPFPARSLLAPLREPVSWDAAVTLANLVFIGGLLPHIVLQWRRRGPQLAELTLLLAWAYMFWAGPLITRYGAVFTCFLFVVVSQSWSGIRGRLSVLSVLLAIMAMAYGAEAVRGFGSATARLEWIFSAGRQYAQALRTSAPGTIVVLNDPNTGMVSPMELTAALGLEGRTVYKASDYPVPWEFNVPWPHIAGLDDADPLRRCETEIREASPGHVVLWQGCGYTLLAHWEHGRDVELADGIRVRYSGYSPFPNYGLGPRLDLFLARPDVQVLWFDPMSGQFKWVRQDAARGSKP